MGGGRERKRRRWEGKKSEREGEGGREGEKPRETVNSKYH